MSKEPNDIDGLQIEIKELRELLLNRNSNGGVLGPSTTVRIGLLMAVMGGFVAIVWWAASTTTKLDSLLTALAAVTIQVRSSSEEITKLRGDVDTLKTVGSPAVRELQSRMVEFERVGSPALVPRIKLLEEQMIRIQAQIVKP